MLTLFDDIDLDDVAQSARWFAPVGCSIQLLDFEGDATTTLHGTGHIEQVADLSSVLGDSGTENQGNDQAAIAFLEVAITWLEQAGANGADVEPLLVLLDQIVTALQAP